LRYGQGGVVLVFAADSAISNRCRVRHGRFSFGYGPQRASVQTGVAPQITGNFDRIDAKPDPPCTFIAGAMSLSMMVSAQGSNEFIAHLTAERGRLHEAQVMGIARGSPADETSLLRDEPKMILVAVAARLGDRENGRAIDSGRVGMERERERERERETKEKASPRIAGRFSTWTRSHRLAVCFAIVAMGSISSATYAR
jgi:hypothetical protein